MVNKKFYYCQADIEDRFLCEEQCDHCAEYYKPLEQDIIKQPRTALALLQDQVGINYPLEDILNNLSQMEIMESMIDYAKECVEIALATT